MIVNRSMHFRYPMLYHFHKKMLLTFKVNGMRAKGVKSKERHCVSFFRRVGLGFSKLEESTRCRSFDLNYILYTTVVLESVTYASKFLLRMRGGLDYNLCLNKLAKQTYKLQTYSKTIHWVRCRLSFSLLCSQSANEGSVHHPDLTCRGLFYYNYFLYMGGGTEQKLGWLTYAASENFVY